MANQVFTEIVRARAAAAVAAAASISGVQHPLVKGRLRELLVDQLLRPILPPSFGLGAGIIMDKEGNSSGEIDIVVFNKDILPPLLFSEREGVFPVEACLYAIEVKSALRPAHIEETIEKFRKVQALTRLPGAHASEPIGMLFAFRDQMSTADSDAVLKRYNSSDDERVPLVRVGCVVGRGYWSFRENSNSWRVFDGDGNYIEVVSFIGGVANTLTNNDWSPVRWAYLRRGAPPVPFGHYIIEDAVSRDVPRWVGRQD